MRPSALPTCLVLAWLAAAPAHSEPPSDDAAGRATLPLGELLDLRHQLDERTRAAVPAKPPVPASLEAIELSGRLVEQSLELGAKVSVTVLEDGWVSVPLLRLAPGLELTERPTVEGATLVVQDGWLALATKRAGAYRFA